VKRDPYVPHPEEMDPNYGQRLRSAFVSASQLLVTSPHDDRYNRNVAVKRQNVPVWCTSRTHSQLKQLIGQLKKLAYYPQMTMLAARKRICLHEPVRASGDPDGACQKAVGKGACPCRRNRGIPDTRARLGKFDLEDLVDYCRAGAVPVLPFAGADAGC
jgi:hypothetical protein